MSAKIKRLLAKHGCPLPYHAVRTCFLGAIATPRDASPIATIRSIWDGQLPPADTISDLNTLLNLLMMTLWNGLTKHQKRDQPFRLQPLTTKATRASVRRLAITRQEELDGFVDGLFGPFDDIELPQRATEAMDLLGDMRALFYASHASLDAYPDQTSKTELTKTIRNLNNLSRIAEKEMHTVVVVCSSARKARIN